MDVDPATPLLYVLSDDLALNGPKFGCGLGQCGACTVIVARPRGALLRDAGRHASNGAEITTLEGLGTPERPHPIQQAFIDEQAAQCGFCLNGVILTAKAFLDQNPKADRRADSAGDVDGAVPLLHAHAHAPRHQALRATRRREPTQAAEPRMSASRRDVPEERRRADRQLQQRRRRWPSDVGARAGAVRHAGSRASARAARLVDRDRRRRPRHGLHRQVRARPGHLHRADAARRRGAVGAARPRDADPVRHVGRRPIRARRPAASRRRRISTRRNLAQAGATAREALLRLASARLGVPVDQLTAADGVISVQGRRVEAGRLRRARRREEVQPARSSATAKRKPRERVDRARHAGAARRHAGDGDRRSSSSSTTCACPACCTAASCGRRRSARRSSASTRARSAACPGVVKVVVKKNFVGVVAEKPWQAIQAARAS